MSFDDMVRAQGGTPVGGMTHEEASPIVTEMMRKFLGVPEDEDFDFTEEEFMQAVNLMPMEEYAVMRRAIASFRIEAPDE